MTGDVVQLDKIERYLFTNDFEGLKRYIKETRIQAYQNAINEELDETISEDGMDSKITRDGTEEVPVHWKEWASGGGGEDSWPAVKPDRAILVTNHEEIDKQELIVCLDKV